MAKLRTRLTELEGAAMGEIFRRGACTAYRLRHEFLNSPSAEWSGSAGAIYPAVRRLHRAGLLARRATADARGTALYRLTAAGRAALDAWLGNVARAVGAGLDPFRSRAGLWDTLPKARRVALRKALELALQQRLAVLQREIRDAPAADARQMRLERGLQKLRLAWLRTLR